MKYLIYLSTFFILLPTLAMMDGEDEDDGAAAAATAKKPLATLEKDALPFLIDVDFFEQQLTAAKESVRQNLTKEVKVYLKKGADESAVEEMLKELRVRKNFIIQEGTVTLAPKMLSFLKLKVLLELQEKGFFAVIRDARGAIDHEISGQLIRISSAYRQLKAKNDGLEKIDEQANALSLNTPRITPTSFKPLLDRYLNVWAENLTDGLFTSASEEIKKQYTDAEQTLATFEADLLDKTKNYYAPSSKSSGVKMDKDMTEWTQFMHALEASMKEKWAEIVLHKDMASDLFKHRLMYLMKSEEENSLFKLPTSAFFTQWKTSFKNFLLMKRLLNQIPTELLSSFTQFLKDTTEAEVKAEIGEGQEIVGKTALSHMRQPTSSNPQTMLAKRSLANKGTRKAIALAAKTKKLAETRGALLTLYGKLIQFTQDDIAFPSHVFKESPDHSQGVNHLPAILAMTPKTWAEVLKESTVRWIASQKAV